MFMEIQLRPIFLFLTLNIYNVNRYIQYIKSVTGSSLCGSYVIILPCISCLVLITSSLTSQFKCNRIRYCILQIDRLVRSLGYMNYIPKTIIVSLFECNNGRYMPTIEIVLLLFL